MVGARFLKLLHTAHVGEVLEVADVPILESFFSLSLCHNAMNFVITGAKVQKVCELRAVCALNV